jgi:hypothetical protein
MWKAIIPGEKLTAGDTIRYQPSSSNFPHRDNIYQVVKAELHYFEVIIQTDVPDAVALVERKIIKYMDIGYHIALELWSGPGPLAHANRAVA